MNERDKRIKWAGRRAGGRAGRFSVVLTPLRCCLAASSYDIRYSSDIKVLRHSFENATQLGESDVISGKLNSPANSSEHETFVIRFPAAYEDKTMFFGLKVNHSASRISDVSNVVSAALVYIQTATTVAPEATTAATIGSASATPTLMYIIGGVDLLILLIFFATTWICCRRIKRARQNNNNV